MMLNQWKELISAIFPGAQFTLEDGMEHTYGEIGDWTAHTGPDMQSDVVGVYCIGSFCSVGDTEYAATDY